MRGAGHAGQRFAHERAEDPVACGSHCLRTLAADLPDAVDLLLLGGAKALYPEMPALVEPPLRAGVFVAADNAEYSLDYLACLAYVRAPEHGYLSVPFGGDVELSMRVRRAARNAGADDFTRPRMKNRKAD